MKHAYAYGYGSTVSGLGISCPYCNYTNRPNENMKENVSDIFLCKNCNRNFFVRMQIQPVYFAESNCKLIGQHHIMEEGFCMKCSWEEDK